MFVSIPLKDLFGATLSHYHWRAWHYTSYNIAKNSTVDIFKYTERYGDGGSEKFAWIVSVIVKSIKRHVTEFVSFPLVLHLGRMQTCKLWHLRQRATW